MYTCHENYTLIGNENRTCTIDGWTGKQPQCLVDWCPDPVQIAGGKVETNGKRAGATAVYKCDAGYVLIGDPVRTFFHCFKLLAILHWTHVEDIYVLASLIIFKHLNLIQFFRS